MSLDVDQLDVGRLSWQARLDAWRLRRRAAAEARRMERRRKAATVALAAVSRVPGVQTTGKRIAVAVALTGLVVGLLLALATLRPVPASTVAT